MYLYHILDIIAITIFEPHIFGQNFTTYKNMSKLEEVRKGIAEYTLANISLCLLQGFDTIGGLLFS